MGQAANSMKNKLVSALSKYHSSFKLSNLSIKKNSFLNRYYEKITHEFISRFK